MAVPLADSTLDKASFMGFTAAPGQQAALGAASSPKGKVSHGKHP